MSESHDVTRLLSRVANGDEASREPLLALLYEDLRRLGERHFRREARPHTLQPTALAHEAYLRLVEQRDQNWQSRAHFLSVAARLIRRILVDHARARAARKRGAGQAVTAYSETRIQAGPREFDALELDEALERLAARDEVAVRVVEMRFFGGQTEDEIAHVLGLGRRTVQRHWAFAKAFLFRELEAS